MMGSGRTSCGSVLAKIIGMSFVDIIQLLIRRLKISQIFNKFEEYFRLREEDYF